ncbi:hypothetical protein Ddye_023905 [Dipteronia dyeriana]|uniref:Inhibitor I9 domain-containing protein n=1 Tax=Dipteronia dyeriana TaxID=168575 RepID=A0AAD9TTU1_9ROSI|nr:hypothetical protein Ddye_023905 [Dipteronia dyeriana]
MGALPAGDYSPSSPHLSVFQEVFGAGRSSANDVLVRSYQRSFNGFAAKLTDQEQKRISRMNGVVSAFPSKTPNSSPPGHGISWVSTIVLLKAISLWAQKINSTI